MNIWCAACASYCDQNPKLGSVVMLFVFWGACSWHCCGPVWRGQCRTDVLHSFHSNWNASLGLGCSRIPVSEECMKPAIETPGGVSTDPYSKTVCCLRCEQKLQRYQLMRASLAPGNVRPRDSVVPAVRACGVRCGLEPAAAEPGTGLGRYRRRRLAGRETHAGF